MPLPQPILEATLKGAFPNALIKIIDLAGDDDHYEVHIADAGFAGLSRIAQHKLVYQALDKYMHKDLHAIAIKTSVRTE